MKPVIFPMSPLLLASSLILAVEQVWPYLLSKEIERHSALKRKIIQGLACSRKLREIV